MNPRPLSSVCSSEGLERLINKRIGIDVFQEKLELLSKSEFYGKALQKPQLKLSKPTDMVLDYEFARLYKSFEGSITRLLTARTNNPTGNTLLDPLATGLYDQQASTMVAHYKDLIRQQDQQLNSYKQKEHQYLQDAENHRRRITDLEQNLQEIKDQYALLKIATRPGSDGNDELRKICEQQQHELEHLRKLVVSQSNRSFSFYFLSNRLSNRMDKLLPRQYSLCVLDLISIEDGISPLDLKMDFNR